MPASVSQSIQHARTQAEAAAQFAKTQALTFTTKANEVTKQGITKAKEAAANNPVATSGIVATILGGATLATALKIKSDADAKEAAAKAAKPRSIGQMILELDLKETLADTARSIRFSTSNLKENGQAVKAGAQAAGSALVDAAKATGSAVMHPVVTAKSAAAGIASGYEATRDAIIRGAETSTQMARQVYADTDFSFANARENGQAVKAGALVAGTTLAEAAKTVPGHLSTAGKATTGYLSSVLGNSTSYLKGLFSKPTK
jgi:hypothetical protein